MWVEGRVQMETYQLMRAGMMGDRPGAGLWSVWTGLACGVFVVSGNLPLFCHYQSHKVTFANELA